MESGGARIGLLDEKVVAGIAAGEVVERPASVVKELVENSLDAGAKRVTVEIDDRGPTRIVVSDDGCGIAAAEMDLALARHATSKIRSLEDLAVVRSYGFRGEALASIAAVSDMELVTAVVGASGGSRVRVSGGRIVERSAAPSSVGTRVDVADLFAAVPARRKFLKSAAHEASLVADIVKRLALADPSRHLRLLRNGKTVVDFPAVGDPASRARQVLGREVGVSLVAVDARFGGMRLAGFASGAGVSFGSARRVNIYVNGRWVRDRFLFRAVMEGYHTYLLKGRYPATALFLEADPAAVDVNVHPAKLEVRFADPSAVHGFVAEALRDSLRAAASPLGRWGLGADEMRARESQLAAAQRRREGSPPQSAGSGGSGAAGADLTAAGYRLTAAGDSEGGQHETGSPPPAAVDALPGYRPAAPEAAASAVEEQSGFVFGAADAAGRLGRYEVVGQVFDGYIVCQGDGEMIMVDQHAAHERLLFERLSAAYRSRGVECQPLLISMPVSVGAAGVEAVENHREALLALGWEIDGFGPEEVVVRAVPGIAGGADSQALAEKLIADLCELGVAAEADKLAARVLATVACHCAVRVGKRLDRRQAAALLAEVATVEFHASCPHGRPVARALTRGQVERMFGR